MPEPTPDARFQSSPDALIRELDDESVLLDLRTENYFGLDEVGTFIWNHLSNGETLSEIVQSIVAEFDVDEETARRDLDDFVNELLARELIKPRG